MGRAHAREIRRRNQSSTTKVNQSLNVATGNIKPDGNEYTNDKFLNDSPDFHIHRWYTYYLLHLFYLRCWSKIMRICMVVADKHYQHMFQH